MKPRLGSSHGFCGEPRLSPSHQFESASRGYAVAQVRGRWQAKSSQSFVESISLGSWEPGQFIEDPTTTIHSYLSPLDDFRIQCTNSQTSTAPFLFGAQRRIVPFFQCTYLPLFALGNTDIRILRPNNNPPAMASPAQMPATPVAVGTQSSPHATVPAATGGLVSPFLFIMLLSPSLLLFPDPL